MSDFNAISEENSRFAVVESEYKESLLINRKATSTNRATKQWVKCLKDYLEERRLPSLADIENDDMPKILEDFYFSIRKKTNSEEDKKNIKLAAKNRNVSILRIVH